MADIMVQDLISQVANTANQDTIIGKWVQPKKKVRQFQPNRYVHLFFSQEKLLTNQNLTSTATFTVSLSSIPRPATRLIGSGYEDGFSAKAYIYLTSGGSASSSTRVTIAAFRYEDASANPNQVDLTVPAGNQTTGQSVDVWHHFSNGRLVLKVALPDNSSDVRDFQVLEKSFRELNAFDPAGGLVGLTLQQGFTLAPDFQLLFVVNSSEIVSWASAGYGPTDVLIPSLEDQMDLVTARLQAAGQSLSARQAAALSVTK